MPRRCWRGGWRQAARRSASTTLTSSSCCERCEPRGSSLDLGAGWLELAALLEQCKGDLHRAVKRTPGGDTTESSNRVVHTLRYEEAALAFDDEASPDGPTFEAHALPSDAAMVGPSRLAARARDAAEEPSLLPPPFRIDIDLSRIDALLPHPPAGDGVRRRARAAWVPPVLVVLAFAFAALLAAALATWARWEGGDAPTGQGLLDSN